MDGSRCISGSVDLSDTMATPFLAFFMLALHFDLADSLAPKGFNSTTVGVGASKASFKNFYDHFSSSENSPSFAPSRYAEAGQ